MIPTDRVYLDPGDRWTGPYDPPRECVVLAQWAPGGGPRNVTVQYLATGREVVVPFPRRLRRTCPDCRGEGLVYDKASHLPVPCDRCQATGRYRRRHEGGL
jgi:hypothetical protein